MRSSPFTALLWLAAALPAQDEATRLIEAKKAKLAAPFLGKFEWLTDYDAARARAKQTGKPILAYFTRSFAASPACDEVERQVFSGDGFRVVAEGAVLFCHITSRLASDRYQDLLPKLGGRSFPHIMFLDADGRPIATVPGPHGLAGIRGVLEDEVKPYIALRDRAATGGKAAKAEWLMKRLALGHLPPAAIQAELQKADYLTKDQRARIESSLASLEVMEILARIDEKDQASYARATQRIVAMHENGRIPKGRAAYAYWQVLLVHAQKEKDNKLATEARVALWRYVLEEAERTENAKQFAEALNSLRSIDGAELDPAWLAAMQGRLKALQFLEQRRKEEAGKQQERKDEGRVPR